MKVLYPIRSRRWIPARAVAGRFVRADCRFGRFILRGALIDSRPGSSRLFRPAEVQDLLSIGTWRPRDPGACGTLKYRCPAAAFGCAGRKECRRAPSRRVRPHRPRWKSMTGFTSIPWGGHSWKRGPPRRHGANLQPDRQRYCMEKHYVRGLRAPAARPRDGGALGHLRTECPCGPADERTERSAGRRPTKMAQRERLANEFTISFFRGALAVEICYPSGGRWERADEKSH